MDTKEWAARYQSIIRDARSAAGKVIEEAQRRADLIVANAEASFAAEVSEYAQRIMIEARREPIVEAEPKPAPSPPPKTAPAGQNPPDAAPPQKDGRAPPSIGLATMPPIRGMPT